jgi:hypothetical protein
MVETISKEVEAVKALQRQSYAPGGAARPMPPLITSMMDSDAFQGEWR